MLEFLQMLFGDADEGWLTVWTKGDKATRWYDVGKLEQATLDADKLAKSDDVYFGVGLRGFKAAEGRGGSDDVTVIPGLWVDIDIAGPAHKETALPPDDRAALDALAEIPMPPTIAIDSGNGLHAYWLFREPWTLDSADERKEAQTLAERWQVAIRQIWTAHGWKLDPTHDLARVLRLPGTYNHKSKPPKPVTAILAQNDARYNPSDFDPYLPTSLPQAADTATSAAFTPTGTEGPASLILDSCKFVQHCQKHATKLSEPEWYAMVTNVARAAEGPALVHELSKPYPKYSQKETDSKIASALEGYPHSCAYIQQQLGFTCPADGCGVKAPCAFALSKVSAARAAVARLDLKQAEAAQVLTEEIIGALAVLKKDEPADYALIKDQLKGRVNLNDLERAVNKQVAANQKLRLVQQEEETTTLQDVMPDVPLKDLRIPYRWTVNENGIWTTKANKGEVESICACMVPVILTKRLRNIDTGGEKVELMFRRDNKWRSIIADRAAVGNRQGLVQLSNTGLPVNSENVRHLIQFFDELERENRDTIPLARSVSHMGWVSGNKFLPGLAGDIELDIDETSGAASVAAGYREQGGLEAWARGIAPMRENHHIARFMLAASFAAPLLKILGHRVFIVHAWGPSRGGKTAALKAALSVWGEPEDLITSFNATRVGLERLAAFYSDLPLGIDERQVVGDKQGFVESLVYLLGLGKGKTRGAKGGGLQAFNHWRTVALTTGEQPLSTSSSTAGIKTRTLELYGIPISDEKLASKLHDTTRSAFGTAGPEFVRQLIALAAEDKNEIQAMYDGTLAQLSEQYPDNVSSHVQAVVAVIVADYYASKWIFGQSDEQAADEALALAEIVLGQLETAAEADDGARAYEYFVAWYRANASCFDGTNTLKNYGRIDSVDVRLLLIYPHIFEEAMKERGYNADRILRDWADRDWIETAIEGGKRRFRIRKREDGSRVYFVGVRLQD